MVPPLDAIEGRRIVEVRRLGKRIVLALEDGLFVVLHLMVAGRLRWLARDAKPPGRITLATFDFPGGRLVLTEAGTKRRASMHLVDGEAALAALDPGGVEPLDCDLATFAAILARDNHTLKRALTDPRSLAGIGNAYSDEILHRAQLSPLALTAKLEPEAVARLYAAMREVLGEWTARFDARGRRGVPGEGHRIPARDGGARQVREALPGVRRAGAAHRLRRERVQLLRALPDRRAHPRRPRAVAAAQGRASRARSTSRRV